MADRRVVITGIGPVTPIGTGLEDFWTGLRGARSVVRRVITWTCTLRSIAARSAR